jgi:hypothetical protein
MKQSLGQDDNMVDIRGFFLKETPKTAKQMTKMYIVDMGSSPLPRLCIFQTLGAVSK